MAAATLGTPGLVIAWLSYLFLLYTLLSSYISGGADILGSLILSTGLKLSDWQTSTLFTLLFGIVVYSGIRQVDLLNRALMFGKFAIYLILVVLIMPKISLVNFQSGDFSYITTSVMVLITSFGFAIIVPNLREYFNDDVRLLRKVILIGSLVPLICYLAWDAVIIGTIPSQGEEGLATLIHSERTNTDLARILSITVQSNFISSSFQFFTSLCMLTAFLGVALCLFSFLSDGLKASQRGRQGLGLFILTFLPPLLVVIYYPGAYLYAYSYAGLFCVILMLLLPALMVVQGRKKFSPRYAVAGGSFTPWLVIIASGVVLLNAGWELLSKL